MQVQVGGALSQLPVHGDPQVFIKDAHMGLAQVGNHHTGLQPVMFPEKIDFPENGGFQRKGFAQLRQCHTAFQPGVGGAQGQPGPALVHIALQFLLDLKKTGVQQCGVVVNPQAELLPELLFPQVLFVKEVFRRVEIQAADAVVSRFIRVAVPLHVGLNGFQHLLGGVLGNHVFKFVAVEKPLVGAD
jgi:hypothetical protein